MERVQLSRSDLSVSRLAIGTYAFGGSWGEQNDGESHQALEVAMQHGVNLVDTARAYGNGRAECLVGDFLAQSGANAIISTKIPPNERRWAPPADTDFREVYPRDYLEESLEQSMENLKVSRLDIVFLHTWSRGFEAYDEWKEVFSEWRSKGLVKLAGISTIDLEPEIVLPAIETGEVDIVQLPFNIFDQQTAVNLHGVAKEKKVSLFGRSALDEGSLTGKFSVDHIFSEGDFRSKYFNKDNMVETVGHVQQIRRYFNLEDDMSLVPYALKFCMSHDAISSVLVGARTATQARQLFSVDTGDFFTQYELDSLKQFEWPRNIRKGLTN